jgi:hypothetical protein
MDDVKSPQVKEFTETATEFCLFIEEGESLRVPEFLARLQEILPLIYSKGLQLPRPRYCYEEEPKKFVKEETYTRILNGIQQKIALHLGIADIVPGARPSQMEMMSYSVAECLTDLYQELKNFAMLYAVGIPQAMNDAVWLCRKGFEQDMGLNLLEGLRSVHQLVFNKTRVAMPGLDNEQAAEDEEPWYSDDQEEVYGDDK